MVTVVVCSVIGILLIIGIIRVLVKPSNSWGDFFLEILLLDLLVDLLGIVFEVIFEALSDL